MVETRCWAEIDLKRIDHNVEKIRELMGPTKIMGIIKADAYGHGAAACAKRLVENGVDLLAAAGIDEAIELRKAGIDTDILILGYTSPSRFPDLERYNLIQSVVGLDYAKELNAFEKPLRIHLKLDTGMNRTGLVYDGSDQAKKQLLDFYGLDHFKKEGIFSHFAVSDELGEAEAFTLRQKELFDDALDFLKKQGIDYGLTHLQNSYGVLNYGFQGYDYCRPGLLYMGVTSDDAIDVRYPLDLKPILSLKSRVGLIKDIDPGQSISYGRHFIAKKPMKVATITIGYADGLTRLCSNKGLEVIVQGKKVPILGNICMDQCVVDVSGLDVKPNDEVIIIGEDNGQICTVDEISRKSETINNETLSRLGGRIERIYLDETSQHSNSSV